MSTETTHPHDRRHAPAPTRQLRLLAVALGTITLVTAGLASTAAGSPSHRQARVAHRLSPAAQERAMGVRGVTRYAVARPACAAPSAPDGFQCFAVQRKAATSTTKGAFAYNPKIRTNQVIGIVDWYDDPHALADLNHFDKQYGLPVETATSFVKVNEHGQRVRLPRPDAGTSQEIALDIESARAVCQKCRIVLVEATRPTAVDLGTAVNEAVKLGATEVSNSYGAAETQQPITAAILKAYDHPGVVITASTGDHGWYGWDFFNAGGESQNSASFPSTDPQVVAVGGTELAINTTGTRAVETVWNENGPGDDAGSSGSLGATGGGCSQIFTAAPWQAHYAHYADTNCDGKRLAADVSAISDSTLGFDIYLTYGGSGWATYGGTSLASPIIAAMFALAGGAHGAAFPASTLYVNAQLHPGSVYDVVPYDPNHMAAGNSLCGGEDPGFCDTLYDNPNGLGKGLLDCSLPLDGSEPDPNNEPTASTECNAAPGFDGPTGLGTPNSLRLFQATTPTITVTTPAVVRAGRAFRLTAAARETIPNTAVTEYDWYFGDGKNASTAAGAVRHAYAKPGRYTLSVYVVDSRYQETIKQTTVVVK